MSRIGETKKDWETVIDWRSLRKQDSWILDQKKDLSGTTWWNLDKFCRLMNSASMLTSWFWPLCLGKMLISGEARWRVHAGSALSVQLVSKSKVFQKDKLKTKSLSHLNLLFILLAFTFSWAKILKICIEWHHSFSFQRKTEGLRKEIGMIKLSCLWSLSLPREKI